jgi:hypothetical protein
VVAHEEPVSTGAPAGTAVAEKDVTAVRAAVARFAVPGLDALEAQADIPEQDAIVERGATVVPGATVERSDIRDAPGAQAALPEQAASAVDNREQGESPAGRREPDVIQDGPSAQAAGSRELLRAPRDARAAEAARWRRSAGGRCWP